MNTSNLLQIVGAFLFGSVLTTLFFMYLSTINEPVTQVPTVTTNNERVSIDSSELTLEDIPVILGGTYKVSTEEEEFILDGLEVVSVTGAEVLVKRIFLPEGDMSALTIFTQNDTVFSEETCTVGERISLLNTNYDCVTETITLSEVQVGDQIIVESESAATDMATNVVAVKVTVLNFEDTTQ